MLGFFFVFVALYCLSIQGLYVHRGGDYSDNRFATRFRNLCTAALEVVHSCQVVARKLLCITRPETSGAYDVELSVNGLEFFSIGYSFTFIPLAPLDKSATLPPLIPIAFYVNPEFVMAGRSQIVTIVGESFQPGCLCYIGSQVALETNFISASEVKCVVPVHVPGVEFLTVVNVGSDPMDTASSQNLILNFNFPATLNLTEAYTQPSQARGCLSAHSTVHTWT